MAANKDTSVTTIDDAPKAAAAPRAKTVDAPADDAMSGEKMEVTIHAGEGEMGQQAVFLAINGHGYNIPRGIPCIVPNEVVDILDNATQTIYVPGEGGKVIEREVKRFSYNARTPRVTTAK